MAKIQDVDIPHLEFAEAAAPGTGAAAITRIYAKADGLMYSKDDAGVETLMSGGAGGGGSGTTWNGVSNGRLTLTTGVPVTISDVTAAATLYFTPYKGNQIGTYSGATWTVSTFTEKSITMVGLTADKNYDVFIVDSTLALEVLIWTNDTTRATALVLQDGVYVKTGATTRRYLGTIRITSAGGACEDSILKRYVFNYHHQLTRLMTAVDTTDTWTYATNSYRQARATTANKVEYVCGVSESPTVARVLAGIYSDASAEAEVGIGIDSTTTQSAQITNRNYVLGTSGSRMNGHAEYRGYPGVGYHYLAWLEIAGSALSVTFYGDDGKAGVQSGISAEVVG